MTQELSFEEIERMRQIVQAHDGERTPMKTIDLNNPPKEPYYFQRFPMMIYDLEASTPTKIIHRTIRSEAELEAALNEGWSQDAPAFGEEREEPLSAAYQAEAARVQEQIEESRRRRGRPRKDAEAA